MDDEQIIELIKKSKGVESDYAVSKLLKVDKVTISVVRRKKRRLSMNTLMKIGKLLNINPNDLLELEEEEIIRKEGFNKGD